MQSSTCVRIHISFDHPLALGRGELLNVQEFIRSKDMHYTSTCKGLQSTTAKKETS